MTKKSMHQLLGQTVHFLVTGFTYCTSSSLLAAGAISTRGDELVITEELVEANTDRNGKCFLAGLHSPEAQEQAYGQRVIAPGPRPDGMLSTTPGTPEHEIARARERHAAFALQDPKDVEAALADIRSRYGRAPTTSRTIGIHPESR